MMHMTALRFSWWRNPVLATALGLAAAMAYPRAAEGAESLESECTDEAWADYNSCLMSSSLEVFRSICDLEFFLEIFDCGKEEAMT